MGFKCETKLRKKYSGHETHGVLPNKCVNLIGAVIDGLAYENIDAQILLPAGSRLPSADPYAGTDAGKNVPTSACPLIDRQHSAGDSRAGFRFLQFRAILAKCRPSNGFFSVYRGPRTDQT